MKKMKKQEPKKFLFFIGFLFSCQNLPD